jgi:hypothetical protein
MQGYDGFGVLARERKGDERISLDRDVDVDITVNFNSMVDAPMVYRRSYELYLSLTHFKATDLLH